MTNFCPLFSFEFRSNLLKQRKKPFEHTFTTLTHSYMFIGNGHNNQTIHTQYNCEWSNHGKSMWENFSQFNCPGQLSLTLWHNNTFSNNNTKCNWEKSLNNIIYTHTCSYTSHKYGLKKDKFSSSPKIHGPFCGEHHITSFHSCRPENTRTTLLPDPDYYVRPYEHNFEDIFSVEQQQQQ